MVDVDGIIEEQETPQQFKQIIKSTLVLKASFSVCELPRLY
jgi:hypothetical protein